MSDTIIKVEGIGKKYRIRHARSERYTALRDVIADKVGNIFHLTGRRIERPPAVEDFWALKDVSFELKRGEVVGIIGRNGAGKSTLLKILSRITEPTEGRVEIEGRVGSLLEIGTGFHPELTGRENIYLNGAIMGMSRVEIKRRFDEMVAFAEVEKFLDTPVKRYSSGMYVRLAFTVAAHLESEILIVDEVLAVGDAEFQKRCFGKIGEVVRDGRAVLIVSHQLQTVVSVCARALVLESGRIVCDAEPDRAVSSYLAVAEVGHSHLLFYRQTTSSDADAEITTVEILDEECQPKSKVLTFDFVRFRIGVECYRPVQNGSVIIEIKNVHGFTVLKLESHPSSLQILGNRGILSIDCCVDKLPLMEGRYLLSVGLAIYGVCIMTWHSDVASLVIASPRNFYQSYDSAGVVALQHRWVQNKTRLDVNHSSVSYVSSNSNS
jgi:lipopolysaccharide transport system ATP-binding protein